MIEELGAECLLCREEWEKTKEEKDRQKVNYAGFVPLAGLEAPNMLTQPPKDWQ